MPITLPILNGGSASRQKLGGDIPDHGNVAVFQLAMESCMSIERFHLVLNRLGEIVGILFLVVVSGHDQGMRE